MTVFAVHKTMTDADFERIGRFVESSCGIKMPPHKKSMAELRLSRRLRALGIDEFDEYCDLVFSEGSKESIWLIDALTTNKTDFFREPEHFDQLANLVLPEALHRQPGLGADRPYRIWSAGCSTGEEACTIAITMLEYSREHSYVDFEILATDISIEVVRAARRGVYAMDRVGDVNKELLRRYFLKGSKDNDLVRAAPEVRDRINFGYANLLDPECYPAEQMDVIFCRNVMIYFERDNQIAVLRALYDALKPGGHLFVGHSETLHGMGLPFKHVAPTLYRKAL